MKSRTIAFVVVTLMCTASTSPALDLGFRWGLHGPGFGSVHGWRGDRHGGFGLSPESWQTRFDDRFEHIMAEYDQGLAEVADFFASDEYGDVLDDTEKLVERHDLYLERIELSTELIDEAITAANEDLLRYEDLLAEYETRDDLSESTIERLESRLTHLIDHTTERVERLTEKQTSLDVLLEGEIAFNDSLVAYLGEITAASLDGEVDPGGGEATDQGDEDVASMAFSAVVAPAVVAATVTAAPEPSAGGLLTMLVLLLAIDGRSRRTSY